MRSERTSEAIKKVVSFRNNASCGGSSTVRRLLDRSKDLLDRLKRAIFIFALGFDLHSRTHGGAEQEEADNAATGRDLAFAFEFDGGGEF